MKTTPTWLDPTFYAFLAIGLLLLGSSLCCEIRAGRTRPQATAQVAVAYPLLAPTAGAPGPATLTGFSD